ncbi:hypothetical protein M5689_006539 [Euphorbia peplus]|nr:hypothetical protein M5689_006539 [Euphorbia peplus]
MTVRRDNPGQILSLKKVDIPSSRQAAEWEELEPNEARRALHLDVLGHPMADSQSIDSDAFSEQTLNERTTELKVAMTARVDDPDAADLGAPA